MFGVLKSQLRDKYKALLILAGTSLAFTEVYLILYPTVRDSAVQLKELFKIYPESFFKAFGLDMAMLTFAKVEYFLSSEVFSVIWPILVIVFAIQLANAAFVSEVEDATIELTLSQPIARLKLFATRYLGGALLMAAFTAITVGGVIPLIMLHGFNYMPGNFWLLAVIGFLFGLSIYSVAVFFSVLYSQKSWSTITTSGILITMYVADIAAGLKTELENIQYVSFFHYFVGATILGKGMVVDYTYPVFLGVTVVFALLAAVWFSWRDIAV